MRCGACPQATVGAWPKRFENERVCDDDSFPEYIQFNFKIISDPKSVDTSKKPDDGAFIHGLMIEGCRWRQLKCGSAVV